MHCAREDCGWQTRRYAVKDGHIHCNDFICFFYFTDVHPGDGGLVVLPGSHKSNFERPDGIFFQDLQDADHPLHPALVNVLPSAGDVVILSELTTHDVLQWKPTDRDRRFLILRYRPQYEGRASLPQKIIERLSPETQELVASASYGHTKETVNQDVITLTT